MKRLVTGISLKQSIFKSLFLLCVASVITFSVVSFFLMKNVVEKNNYVQNDIIVTLFTEIISQDVLVGAHYEVYKKCQNALSRESVLAIEVKQLNGTLICDIKKDKYLSDSFIKKVIYFDLAKKEKAADVSIYFSQDALSKLFIFYLYLIGALILVLIIAVYSFSKRISNKISLPLKELNDAMAMNLFINKYEDGQSKSVQIREFSELRDKFRNLMSNIELYQCQLVEASNKEAVAKVATQAAHDIRSPLEMLKSTKNELNGLDEASKRRIQLSINRIEEITFNLLKTHKKSNLPNELKSEELLSLVTSVITEKNIEFRNRDGIEIQELFDSTSYGVFSKIQRSSLKSIISNFINNGVDSLGSQAGFIKVALASDGDRNVIKVSDSGPGISPDVSSKLFTKGFTTKKTGNGLGLFNAKQDIEAAKGTIEFTSVIGKGTTFIISLPKSDAPKTFVPSIDANKYERIIILDDDPAFHEVWNKRLEGFESKLEHIHSVKEMLSKYQALHPKILLLSDFELMDKDLDGIDVILKLNHAEHSVLVTARNEEQAIQDRCLKGSIKLLPKSLVNYVRVSSGVSPSGSSSKLGDASMVGGTAGVPQAAGVILIDDDRLIRYNWETYFKKLNIQFRAFKSIDEFLASSDSIDKNSKIYIDSDLGDGIRGEVESEKIFNLGFLNLYMATGFDKDSIQKPHWIKEIYSKSPGNVG